MMKTVEKPQKFTGKLSEVLPENAGRDIITNGNRLGTGGHEKDCYWSGYEKDGKYYVSLNDDIVAVWWTSYEDMKLHCLTD